MSKNLEISVLLDYYGGMLTDKQRDVIDLYYNQDLSLAEIAEHEKFPGRVCVITSSAARRI